jgi:hypothetical protein
MKTMKRKIIILISTLILSFSSFAQNTVNPDDVDDKKDLRFNFNKSGTHYVKFTVTNQVWIRFNESNPGTLVNSVDKPYTFDIGIRRLRFQIIGQLHEKFLVYVQFGINNFNALSPRKVGDFFHDAVVEYTPVKIMNKNENKKGQTVFSLSIGAGLTAWTGPSRFSSPGVASFLGIDAPLYQQTTNDATDQFLRKLAVYVKGKAWKFDYRFAVVDPLTITTSTLYNPLISQYANFSPIGRSVQTTGYVNFQFLDQEDNQLPYQVGTYLGKKRVLNLGGGFQYQPDAMWYTRTGTDTSFADMFIVGADVFYDTYLGKNKEWGFSAYGAYNYMNYGPNYLRMLGPMNPGQSVAAGTPQINGAGTAYPMLGTGHVGYLQTGVMLPKKWFSKKDNPTFTMMPYFCAQVAKWDRLNDIMATFDAGLNFLFDGHKYKMTINYQNRPVFNNTFDVMQRNSMVNFQFQVAL